MTGIAIVQSHVNTARIVAAMLLVTIGLVAGFLVAQVVSNSSAGATTQAETISLSDDAAYQAQRAEERSGLGGSAGYNAQRAGERTTSTGSQVEPDSGWRAQRAGERAP